MVSLIFSFFHKIVSAFGPAPTISGAYVLTLVILVFSLGEGFINTKKVVENSTKGPDPSPPPPLVGKILSAKNYLHAIQQILNNMGL